MKGIDTILVCTLGASWAVIPEIVAFLDPEWLPLYANHNNLQRLEELRQEWQLTPPDEIWVVTTEGERTTSSLELLAEWWHLLDTPRPLRVWQAAGTGELAGEEECARIRELILRLVLKAGETTGSIEKVMLSLAGGRKTMSADLQRAGTTFGCGALLHVVDSSEMPECLRSADPDFLTRPLPVRAPKSARDNTPVPCAGVVTPLVVGRGYRSELLDVDWQDMGIVESRRFPLPEAPVITASGPGRFASCRWQCERDETSLDQEISAREKEGQQLLSNYLAKISSKEHHENWRSLYRLPPRLIRKLRETRLTEAHRAWLQQLPKAELHCHLGGVLDLPAQRRVGQAVWKALSSQARRKAEKQVEELLAMEKWPWKWPEYLKGGNRSANCTALLVKLTEAELARHLYDATEPRFALQNSSDHDFSAYERPGELSGSAILGHEAAVESYAAEVYEQVVASGLLYCELRGSPLKYLEGNGPDRVANGLRFLRLFRQGLERAQAAAAKQTRGNCLQPEICFIIIADRRDAPGDMERIRLAAELVTAAARDQELRDFVVGLDLAGKEEIDDLKKIAASDSLEEVFQNCLPVTVHAGEGTSAEMIWQAAYLLNADRIGHGLKLVDNPELAERFRNRDICLELCPTSNLEVVGFKRQNRPGETAYEEYPLQRLWELGLPLTLCTDNPGISRTSLANEYIVASRELVPGGLSLWDTLAMLKQAFSHAFLPATRREKLMKEADHRIFEATSQIAPELF